MTTVSEKVVIPPVQSVVKDIKKEQILAEYQKQTRLPIGILELIYDTCEKMDEKKLKALKKGNIKVKEHQRIKRPDFTHNQTIVGVDVKEGKPEEYPAPEIKKDISTIEEIEE